MTDQKVLKNHILIILCGVSVIGEIGPGKSEASYELLLQVNSLNKAFHSMGKCLTLQAVAIMKLFIVSV